MKKLASLILTLSFLLLKSVVFAQSVSFAVKTSPNVDLVFDTIDKYKNGIILPSFLTLRVESIGTEWDLYVGTSTATGGFFDLNNAYSSTGNSMIPVGILQARVSNPANTSLTGSSFFNLTDISNPTYLIGSTANDATVNCGTTGANVPGSYSSSPQCYTFKVDLKANPGLNYRAGSYALRVDFVLIQDL